MNKELIIENANSYCASSALNQISKEKALSDELVSVRMFDEPIIGLADAGDKAFQNLKSEGIIGEHFMLPEQWLPKAKSVITFFFPFTETIRNSNRKNMSYPSKGWLNARIEGQYFINHFSASIVELLKSRGFMSVSPSIDSRFFSNHDSDKHGIGKPYTSNWSERHVAYICGTGTLSLSKGLITEKGMAGRLTSVITELSLTPDEKKFQRFDENCILCGKCINNCPANAISFEHGKNHQKCFNFLSTILSENAPWYGCGKCQVNVPCEYRNPRR